MTSPLGTHRWDRGRRRRQLPPPRAQWRLQAQGPSGGWEPKQPLPRSPRRHGAKAGAALLNALLSQQAEAAPGWACAWKCSPGRSLCSGLFGQQWETQGKGPTQRCPQVWPGGRDTAGSLSSCVPGATHAAGLGPSQEPLLLRWLGVRTRPQALAQGRCLQELGEPSPGPASGSSGATVTGSQHAGPAASSLGASVCPAGGLPVPRAGPHLRTGPRW